METHNGFKEYLCKSSYTQRFYERDPVRSFGEMVDERDNAVISFL
jgi:hypothetical protein